MPKSQQWKSKQKIIIAGAITFAVGLFLPFGVFVQITLIFLGLAILAAGVVMMAAAYVQEGRKHKEDIAALKAKRTEEIRNSPEYIQQCREIDEQNQQNQQNQAKLDRELHEKYLSRYEKYKEDMRIYEQDVAVYNKETYPQWKEEEQTLKTALNDTKAALREVYGRNILPAQYRNRAAVLYLAVFMGTSDFDLKYAIERYDTSVMLLAQREQIDLAKAQVVLANEAVQNQEYANWLNEQTLDMAERGNEILKSIDNWQKADIAVREYRRFKAKRAAKKARK